MALDVLEVWFSMEHYQRFGTNAPPNSEDLVLMPGAGHYQDSNQDSHSCKRSLHH